MEVRDAVEDDAEALGEIADVPADVVRNLVHDRSVRVAFEPSGEAGPDADAGPDGGDGESLLGFVSFDARPDAVHVTQLDGTPDACRRLLTEPVSFARREGMAVELLVRSDRDDVRAAAEDVGLHESGEGPRFDGHPTVRYRMEP